MDANLAKFIPSRPKLNIRRRDNEGAIRVTWPLDYPAWQLQFNSDPATSNAWEVEMPPYATDGPDFTFTTGALAVQRFFRLYQP